MKIFNFEQQSFLHNSMTDITQLIQQKLVFLLLLLTDCLNN